MYLHDLHTGTSELLKYYFLLARLLGDPDLIVNKNNVVLEQFFNSDMNGKGNDGSIICVFKHEGGRLKNDYR